MPLVFAMCGLFIIIVQPILPHIINVFMFMNESRSRMQTFMVTEYFIDQDKYFYLMLLHMETALCVAVIVFVAIGTTLLALHKHACGMFSIAG